MGSIDRWCQYIALWRERKGFVTSWENVPEKLMLVVSELSEALEEYRKEPVDAIRFGEEIADAVIRLFDLAGSLGLPLEAQIVEKMRTNLRRGYRHDKRL